MKANYLISVLFAIIATLSLPSYSPAAHHATTYAGNFQKAETLKGPSNIARAYTSSRYLYPLSEQSLLNPLAIGALSAGTCYLSFLCSLFNSKAKPIVLLSGITTIGSVLYTEYLYRKALHAIPIKQITVRTQEDGTCVAHAIANALTLHEIVTLHKKIATANTTLNVDILNLGITEINNANSYNHIYGLLLKDMNTSPMLGLSQNTTAELIERLNSKETIFQIRYDQIGNTTHPEYVKLKKQVLKLYNQTNDTHAVHIKCTLTYPWDATLHAVIISLIKKTNGTVALVYMDSNNISLRFCPQAVEYIRFIYDNLLP